MACSDAKLGVVLEQQGPVTCIDRLDIFRLDHLSVLGDRWVLFLLKLWLVLRHLVIGFERHVQCAAQGWRRCMRI